MRLAGTKLAANHQYRGFGDQLYDLSGQRPSLDLQFANQKSLVDATTGQNLVTFTRASSGTYVDSQGVIQRATTNLLLRSEEFDNAIWSKTNATVTPDAITSPTGLSTADALFETTATGEHYARQLVTGLTANTNHTISVYIKNLGGRNFRIRVLDTDNTANGYLAGFSPSLGTINTAATAIGSGIAASASITPLANDWYRVALTGNAGASCTKYIVDFYSVSGTTVSFAGDATKGIYLWGAQLEASSSPGEYIPTTSTINSAPRFDHSPTTGESLGLLVEEQRTNLLLQSEAFDTASWNKVVGGTGSTPVVNTNTATSPDGTTTADQLVLALNGGTTTSDSSYITQSYSSTSGTTYTVSAWMRTITGNVTISFDLDSSNTNTVTVTPVWQRFTFTRTSSTTGSRTVRIGLRGTFGVSDSATFYIWGAQLEAGAFPTSYIPTTTATVTRSADVASITGSNFSSWYRQDEGTIYSDAIITGRKASTAFVQIQNSDATNRLQLRQSADGLNVLAQAVDGANSSAGLASTAFTLGLGFRAAFAFKASDYAASFNSSAIGSSSALTTIPSVDRLAFTPASGSGAGTIRRLTYWPRRLPDFTLQGITQ